MKLPSLLLIGILLLQVGVLAQEQDPTASLQNAWVEDLEQQNKLDKYYSSASGLLIGDVLHMGSEAITERLQSQYPHGMKSYEALETHQLRPTHKFVFGLYTVGDNFHASIIGWRKQGKWVKEFEVIYPSGRRESDAIDQADALRQLWVELANLHDPAKIGTDVFSPNGVYFNRGRVYSSDQIGQAYSYMSNESFQISLQALMVRPIDERITYEIGEFNSGGRGLYVLIWVKEETGWRLLLDFNF